NADLPGCHAYRKGENDRSLITSDKQNPTAQPGHRLSDRVPANTNHALPKGADNIDAHWETPVQDEVDEHLDPRDRASCPPSMISTRLGGAQISRPAPPAIAQRFSGVPSMFSSSEVKVLHPT